MKYKNIIVTGSIAYDEIMDFPGEFKDHFHADKLHQINASFVVDRLEKQLGGTATNISYNIRQILNVHIQNNSEFKILNSKLYLLGAVGKDGSQFVEFFKKQGIDTSGLLVDKFLYTSTGKVITDKIDNQIWGFYYGASSQTHKINLKKYADKNSLVIISANHPAGFLKFQKQAIKIGCDYLYDPGMTLTWIANADLKEGIMSCRWLVGNDYEIGQIEKRLKTSVKKMCEWGVTVITTLGEKGAKYQYKVNQVYKVNKVKTNKLINRIIPAVKLKKVVDPTGAGDAWRGGFITGIIAGKPIDDCVKWANVCASFAVEKFGTVNHVISKNEFEKRRNTI